MRHSIGGALFCLWVCIGLGGAAVAQSFPELAGRVVDTAGILDTATENKIAAQLKRHEEKTGQQVVVATVPSLQGYTVEDFGVALGRAWKIGSKDKNDGLLLIVAPKERKVRIEVGYGLEGQMPDATAARIINTIIVPEFKKKQMAVGIENGIDAILAVLGGKTLGYATEDSLNPANDPGYEALFFLLILVTFLLFTAFSTSSGSRRTGGRWLKNGSGSGGSFSRGGFTGGGFSGGGGSFGGGGASGGW